VKDAHTHRLAVHPYTVRADELPKGSKSLGDLHRLIFTEAGVDGVFSDFPDRTVAFVRALRR
jgi:glycerophosphoryl diester phosphodiesterase